MGHHQLYELPPAKTLAHSNGKIPENFTRESREEYIKRLETALMAHYFVTNDVVRIPACHQAVINGKPVKLGAHAFTVLVLLAEMAINSPGDFASTEALIRAIKCAQRRLGALKISWLEPTDDDIFKAVSEIRLKLDKAGLDESLIESERGYGYRLSTPGFNILIDPSVSIFGGAPPPLPTLRGESRG